MVQLGCPSWVCLFALLRSCYDRCPESYHSHEGCMSKYSTKVAWWPFNLINQYQNTNFAAINADVRKKAREVEDEAMQRKAAWEVEADMLVAAGGQHAESEALKLLTAHSNQFAEEVIADWWAFATSIFTKFGRYVVTYNETATGVDGHGMALPAWWLRSPEVGFTTWTASGPFHGVYLDAAEVPATLLENAGPFVGPMGYRPSVLLMLLPWGAVLIAYGLGVRRGRRSLDTDAHYVLQP